MCGAFDDVSAGAGGNRFLKKSGIIELAHHQNLGGGQFAFDETGRFQAVHRWHSYVHQHQVRFMFAGFTHSIESIGSLADDLDIGFGI